MTDKWDEPNDQDPEKDIKIGICQAYELLNCEQKEIINNFVEELLK